jgi:hypothetical protein
MFLPSLLSHIDQAREFVRILFVGQNMQSSAMQQPFAKLFEHAGQPVGFEEELILPPVACHS